VKPGLDLPNVATVVRNPSVRSIAIANPATAPYGRAAKQALEALGLLAEAQPKLVTAEDISQTAQFVDTGNADVGFVALSSMLTPKMKGKGRWIEVSTGLYRPLVQGAIVTTHGRGNPAAAGYLAFLHSEAASKVLEAAGYGAPSGK
jgi:molybdate transport system substrate-binding protein